MAKLWLMEDTPQQTRYAFDCPGCAYGHWVRVKGQGNDGTPSDQALWTWNGSLDAPTFSPSIHTGAPGDPERCHSFVESGFVRFLPDSWHPLAGQTVELPEWG